MLYSPELFFSSAKSSSVVFGVLLLFIKTILSTGTSSTTLQVTNSETISSLTVDLALILNSVTFKSAGTVKYCPSVITLISSTSDGTGEESSSLTPFCVVPSGLKFKNFEMSVLSPLTTGTTAVVKFIDVIGLTTLTVMFCCKLPSSVLTVIVIGPPCSFASKTPTLTPSLTCGFVVTGVIKLLTGTINSTAPS